MKVIETDKALIILIGGAAGTGKSSLARELCSKLEIAHRLGSGFIREMAKSFLPQEENPFLYNYSFRPHADVSPFENLYKQSEGIKDSIEGCISRAYNEGTSLVIEGVNIIPGLIRTDHVSLNMVLTIDDYDLHLDMVQGKTHHKRQINQEDFKNIREIQNEFKRNALANNWQIINRDFESKPIEIIRKMLKEEAFDESLL